MTSPIRTPSAAQPTSMVPPAQAEGGDPLPTPASSAARPSHLPAAPALPATPRDPASAAPGQLQRRRASAAAGRIGAEISGGGETPSRSAALAAQAQALSRLESERTSLAAK